MSAPALPTRHIDLFFFARLIRQDRDTIRPLTFDHRSSRQHTSSGPIPLSSAQQERCISSLQLVSQPRTLVLSTRFRQKRIKRALGDLGLGLAFRVQRPPHITHSHTALRSDLVPNDFLSSTENPLKTHSSSTEYWAQARIQHLDGLSSCSHLFSSSSPPSFSTSFWLVESSLFSSSRFEQTTPRCLALATSQRTAWADDQFPRILLSIFEARLEIRKKQDKTLDTRI